MLLPYGRIRLAKRPPFTTHKSTSLGSSMGNRQFKIAVQLDQEVVQAGEVVTGKVLVSIPQNVSNKELQHFRSINLVLNGTEYSLVAAKPGSIEYDLRRRKGKALAEQSERTVCHAVYPLVDLTNISNGQYEYPFQLPMRRDLPGSFSCKAADGDKSLCQIKYTFLAYIEHQGQSSLPADQLCHQLDIKVKGASPPPSAPSGLISTGTQAYPISSCWIWRQGKIVMGWRAADSVAAPEDTVHVHCWGENQSRVKVEYIGFKYTEEISWQTLNNDGARTSSRTYTRVLAEERQSVNDFAEWDPKMFSRYNCQEPLLSEQGRSVIISSLNIPTDARETYKGSLVEIKHVLTVSVKTKGTKGEWGASSPEASLPVTIAQRGSAEIEHMVQGTTSGEENTPSTIPTATAPSEIYDFENTPSVPSTSPTAPSELYDLPTAAVVEAEVLPDDWKPVRAEVVSLPLAEAIVLPRHTIDSTVARETSTSAPVSARNSSSSSSRWIPLYKASALDSRFDHAFIALLIMAETLLGWIIIHKVPYTEIDWQAYMEEVEAWWVDGEYDYQQIRGGTGPLVYPAGFLYLFAFFRSLTKGGTSIRQAQYIFWVLYVLIQATVLNMYHQCLKAYKSRALDGTANDRTETSVAHLVWCWRIIMGFLCLSKRLHSIFLLRLFNDGPTMLLFYISVALFLRQRWNWGCLFFSFAVSLKMNVLLFAPGLLLLLLQSSPNLFTVIFERLFAICAMSQLVLGAPFLLTYPISYLRKAFELDRVFFYKWTVNFKFLPEDIFVSKRWALILLILHLSGLTVAAVRWIQRSQKKNGRRIFLKRPLSADYIAYTMMVSNFMGIAFARTLHYQFYVSFIQAQQRSRFCSSFVLYSTQHDYFQSWYFHSIPLLLWYPLTQQPKPPSIRTLLIRMAMTVVVMGSLEGAFLTFPATSISSLMLQVAHAIVLWAIEGPQYIQQNEEPRDLKED